MENKEVKAYYAGEGIKKYRSWFFSFFIIVAIFIGAIFLANTSFVKKTEESIRSEIQQTASKSPPKENLSTINAKILSVDPTKKEITASFVGNISWSRQWKLSIKDETILTTSKSWSKASSLQFEARAAQTGSDSSEKIFEANLIRLSLADFKVGDNIYVISGGDDFAKTTEAKNVQAILLQKI